MTAAWAFGRLGSPVGQAVRLGMTLSWSISMGMKGKWMVNGWLIVDDFTHS